MHYVPAPLALRGFGSGLILRSLRIRILSGCVGGFFMPKTMPKNKGISIHKCAFCYFSYSGLACFTKA